MATVLVSAHPLGFNTQSAGFGRLLRWQLLLAAPCRLHKCGKAPEVKRDSCAAADATGR